MVFSWVFSRACSPKRGVREHTEIGFRKKNREASAVGPGLQPRERNYLLVVAGLPRLMPCKSEDSTRGKRWGDGDPTMRPNWGDLADLPTFGYYVSL